MSVSVIGQDSLKLPYPSSKESLEKDEHTRREGAMAPRLRLVLRLGIGLLIVLWLVCAVWVVPVG
jgi:hypothetical protein